MQYVRWTFALKIIDQNLVWRVKSQTLEDYE